MSLCMGFWPPTIKTHPTCMTFTTPCMTFHLTWSSLRRLSQIASSLQFLPPRASRLHLRRSVRLYPTSSISHPILLNIISRLLHLLLIGFRLDPSKKSDKFMRTLTNSLPGLVKGNSFTLKLRDSRALTWRTNPPINRLNTWGYNTFIIATTTY